MNSPILDNDLYGRRLDRHLHRIANPAIYDPQYAIDFNSIVADAVYAITIVLSNQE